MYEIYDIADEEEITVTHMNTGNIKAISVKVKNERYININPELVTETEERVCLAHELGHHLTNNAYYNTTTSLQARKRREYKADRWAVEQLIDIEKLKENIKKGIATPWELAEVFEVTEDFILRAIQIYKNKGVL